MRRYKIPDGECFDGEDFMLPENEIENFVTERSKAYPFFKQLLFNVEMYL